MKDAPEPEKTDFVRQLLDDFGLTKADLADTLGLSPGTVDAWVRGRIIPQPWAFKLMREYLDRTTATATAKACQIDAAGWARDEPGES